VSNSGGHHTIHRILVLYQGIHGAQQVLVVNGLQDDTPEFDTKCCKCLI
jgi:hypothetical protein